MERTSGSAGSNGGGMLSNGSKNMDFLRTMVKQICDHSPLDSVVQHSLQAVMELTDADLIMLFLREDDRLVIKGKQAKRSDFFHDNTPVHKVGECLCGIAVRERRKIISYDIRKDPRCTWDECKESGIVSIAALPLFDQDDIIGVLTIASSSLMEFESQIELLEIISDQITIGYQNALVHDELEMQKKKLEEERKRAEFYLDLMSHDITNIHQGINTWIQLTKERSSQHDRDGLGFEVGEKLIHRSINLVENVKLLSSLKGTDLILTPIDLNKATIDAIDHIKKVFPDEEITINYKAGQENLFIQAEVLIDHLLFNLLHNCIKFQKGSRAEVDVEINRSEDGNVQLIISDRGPGISEDMKAHIFDRYKMKDIKFHAGIGLSLVKELVDRYHGQIMVADRIEGEPALGAKFIITFP